MSIRPLPEDVVGRIRSSSTITALNGVVCGLLKNALDAGATKVNIYIDYGRGNCTVEDNGVGIVPGDFAEDGGLGKSYYSSKFPTQQWLHGRQGTFLASLGTLSLLTVTSHHLRHNSHNSLSIHHGRVLKRQTQSVSGERFDAFDHGTRVAVNDLFGSLPVRVKHRAALFADRSGLDKEWGRLVYDVVGLLVAWSSGAAVFLRDTKGQRELRLKPPENASMVPRALRYFVQASMADSGEMDSWVPVSATAGHVAIKGCISLTPVATRRSQFMSMGVLPLSNEHGNNVLYEEVNKMFKNSDFGMDEGKAGDTGDHVPNPQKKSKGADRWPVFYLRITLKGSQDVFNMDDISSHSHGDLQKIIDLLRAMTYSFLNKHHMRPQKVHLSSDKSVFSTAPRRSTKASTGQRPSSTQASIPPSSLNLLSDSSSSLSDSPFDGWSTMKVGPRTKTKQVTQREPALAPAAKVAAKRLLGEGGKLLRKPFDIPDSSGPEDGSIDSSETDAGSTCAKGSLSLAERPKSIAEPSLGETAKRSKVGDSDVTGGKSEEKKETSGREEPEWLQDLLKSWRNPVFEPTEPLIPRINDEAPAPMRETTLVHGLHRCRNDGNGGVKFEAASIGIEGRVSRSALEGAEVIAQVDKKFIMLKLPLQDMQDAPKAGSSCALVMLDQHAADERCRLEDLMIGYFREDPSHGVLGAVVEPLERPLMFETSEREYGLLQRFQGHLEAWGILYTAAQQAVGHTVTVTALPPSILERCRSEPRLLVDLIRKEIWKLDDEGIVPPRPRSSSAGKGTLNQALMADFHGCPRGILELLHSRACRSAVMFNDVLSPGECEHLVRRLARCAFPFQCAHGRPSLVPLVDLGSACHIRAWDGDGDGDGGKDLKAWKRWIDA